MTRQRWKDTLESVGIISIVASLIFVGIETRNSTQQAVLTTQALEITAYQELNTNIEEMNILTMHSDAAASTMAKVWMEPGDIESFRERRAIFLLLRHGDMAFYMYERGAIRALVRPLADPRVGGDRSPVGLLRAADGHVGPDSGRGGAGDGLPYG